MSEPTPVAEIDRFEPTAGASEIQIERQTRNIRVAGAAFVAAWLTLLALAPGHVNNVDGYVVYHSNEQFLAEGRLTIEEVPGREYTARVPYVRVDGAGNRYQVYGHVFFWLALPFTALGTWLAPVIGLDTGRFSEFTYSLTNTFLSALGIAVWCALGVRLGARRRGLALLGPLLTLSTPILFYALSMWREPGILLLVGLGALTFLGAVDRRESGGRVVLFGAVLGLLFLFKEGNAIVVACLWIAAVASVWRGDDRPPFRFAVLAGWPIAVAIAIHAAILHVRFGDPLSTCYDPSRGLLAGEPIAQFGRLLASPEVGLVFYAAPVLLGLFGVGCLWRGRRDLTVALLAMSILFLALHAVIVNGEGGRFVWGTRHLVPVFPVFLIGLVLALERVGNAWRRAAMAVVVLSTLLQLVPVLTPYNLYPDLREDAPPEVRAEMPSRIPGSLLVVGHVAGAGKTKLTGDVFGVDREVTWNLAEDRVAAGRINVWWLRRDAPGTAPIAGGLLLLAAAGAWVWYVRKARGS